MGSTHVPLGPSEPLSPLSGFVCCVSKVLGSRDLPDSAEAWYPVGAQEVEIDTLSAVSCFPGSFPRPASLPVPRVILGSNDFEC